MAVVVIDTIKPKNNGTFPVVEAVDVKVTDSKRLDAALNDKANQSDVTALQTAVAGKASQADLTALSETVSGKQDTLTTEQLAAANSGITSELVTQIGTNTTAIAGKASQADLESTNSAVATKANASDVATETANLQAQIDALVTPVTQDAEVENARVGADGTSYQTLKARLDSENIALNNDVSNNLLKIRGMSEANINKLPVEVVSKTLNNVGISYNDGSFVFTGTANDSGGRNTKILPFTLPAGTYYAKLFNVNGTIPSVYIQNGTTILAQPSDSAYVSFYLAAETSVHIGFSTTNETVYSSSFNMMIAKQTQPSSYIKPNLIAIDSTSREKIAELEPIKTASINPTIYSYNLHTLAGISVGKYVNQGTGALANNDNYIASDYITVTASQVYCFYNISRFAWYDSAKNYISGGFIQSPEYKETAPANAAYIRYSWDRYDYGNTNVVFTTEAYYNKKIRIHNDANSLEIDKKSFYSENLHSIICFSSGKFVNSANGELGTNASYNATNYIPVTASTEYGAFKIAHYAWYDSSKNYISGGTNPEYITSPATAAFIRYSWDISDGSSNIVFAPKANYDKSVEIHNLNLSKMTNLHLYPVNGKVIRTADAMSDNDKLETGIHNVKKNNVYSFTARITSFGEIKVGHGTNVYGSSYLTINDTKVTLTNYSNSASTTEFEHGLTIADFITVTIITSVDKFKFIITTNGGRYEHDNLTWAGNGRATSYAECVSGSLTDCEFSWTCRDLTKRIYMFGDSYLTTDVPTRWPYYLVRDGFIDDVLISNYPGESGADAILSFNTLISLGKPCYAVWCLGMNDGSDESDEPSERWLTNVNTFLARCKLYGITPILATIPSVPTIDHTYKNAWVRNSGYRYIDFEKAVGADISTSWYTDMLSGDGVHPDTLGAEALYNRALLDFPEIVFDD